MCWGWQSNTIDGAWVPFTVNPPRQSWVSYTDWFQEEVNFSYISHCIWGSFCHSSLIWFLTNISDHSRMIVRIMISNCFDGNNDLISLQWTLLDTHPPTPRGYKFKKRSKVWFMVMDLESRKYSQVVKPAQFSLAASFQRLGILPFQCGLLGEDSMMLKSTILLSP